MALENIVLLSMARHDFAAQVELKKRSEENSVESTALSLFEQAKQAFNRSAAKRFGFFDGSHQNWFQKILVRLEV